MTYRHETIRGVYQFPSDDANPALLRPDICACIAQCQQLLEPQQDKALVDHLLWLHKNGSPTSGKP
jgi:hypothetical protein